MSDFLTIGNDGQYLTSTNFWEHELNAAGKYYFSINAGALRILIPDGLEHLVNEMRTAQSVELELERERDIINIWFVDGTETPFCLSASLNSIFPTWGDGDAGKTTPVLVYTRGPILVLSLPGIIVPAIS